MNQGDGAVAGANAGRDAGAGASATDGDGDGDDEVISARFDFQKGWGYAHFLNPICRVVP